MFESWDTGLYWQHHSLHMSDNEFEERVDEVDEFVSKLLANDRTVRSFYHEFDKWEHELDAWSNAEDRATLDADVVKLYRALENNTVVRRVDVSGSFGTISSRGATAIGQALSGNRSISDVTICWDGDIFTGPNTMKTVLRGLVGNHNIKKLTISGNAGHDGSQSPSTLGGSLSRILGKFLQDSSIDELVFN